MQSKFRIAFIDIETSPNLGWTWGKYEQNVIEFQQEWFLLSFSVKWAGESKPKTYALPDFPGYVKDKTNDRELAMKLAEVLDEADLVVAHNGDRFDIKKINTRLLIHNIHPPSPYKTLDTLKLAKKYFGFNSNKLNDICHLLGFGRKLQTGGFDLWLKCYEGDVKAWAKMKKYNAHDVVLLEKVYNKFRAWHSTHPNITLKQQNTKYLCPACGSPKTQQRGWYYISKYRVKRHQCTSCGKWSKGEREKIPGDILV